VFIGAITFTGSVIAYGKLAGKVTSAAVKLPGGHAAERGGGCHLGAVPDLVHHGWWHPAAHHHDHRALCSSVIT
jgi:hypothetical protein